MGHLISISTREASAATDPTYRADLAQTPHTITVEQLTPAFRADADLPAAATLVVIERHAGHLAKVCGATDANVADLVSWGYKVTIEDLARGIADTYGATYVPSTVVKTVPAQGGVLGYRVHAIREGAPLPGGQRIAEVEEYGSDSYLIAVDEAGRDHHLHRHAEIREMDGTGVVRLVEPQYTGWAAD